MFTYFKNASIRKLVIGFGSLFKNVHIIQKEKDGSDRNTLVPLTYAPKEKYIKRLTLPSSISDQTRVELNNPQLSFELTNIQYDPIRHMHKLHKKHALTGLTMSYMEVPYNFTFNLHSYTRNIDENLEIMEQILPYFSPEFIISINFTELHTKVDVPISLMQTNLTQDYEGDFNTRRLIISSYQFVAKSYVYGKVGNYVPITDYGLNYDINGITFSVEG